MNIFADLAAWSLTAFGTVLFLAQMLAHEIGFRFGRRYAARHGIQPEGVGVVVGAMLALLAFVLALTLSFASARFHERRSGGLEEANAIGTAWLRAEAIGHPRGTEIARLLEEYTRLRAAFVGAPREMAKLGELDARSAVLQGEIWAHTSALVRERTDAIASSVMAAVNDAFDAGTVERLAFAITLPAQPFWLLITMALIGIGALGFQIGLRGRPLRLLAALLTAMWTVVMIDILDLATARLGTFRSDTTVYQWTLDGFRTPPAAGR